MGEILRKEIIILIVLFGVFLAIGCTGNKTSPNTTVTPNNAVTPNSAVAPVTTGMMGNNTGMMGNRTEMMGNRTGMTYNRTEMMK